MRNFIEPALAPTGAQSPTTNYGAGDPPPAQASIAMPPSPNRTPWLTVRLAAREINVSESSVRRLLSRGALPFSRIGAAIRIHQCDIAAFMRDGGERGATWHL
jgi:excisionase family DNA binding protein